MPSDFPPSEFKRLVIVEDDPDFRESLVLEFQDRAYVVAEAENVDALQVHLSQSIFDFAVVDLRLQGDSGLDAVSLLHARLPHCRIVVLTGYGSIPTAVEAVKRGACHYLTKPVPIERLEKSLWFDFHPNEEESYESLERHEQEYLEYVLLQCEGNISEAARRLGLHRQSLQRKLRRTGLN